MAKKKSKKYLEVAKKVEADKAYTANEAVALVKRNRLCKLRRNS